MTPELHDYLVSVTANVRKLATLIQRLAHQAGYDTTAQEALRVADDMLDAYNTLDT